MPDFEKLIDQISEQTETWFGPASKRDLSALRDLGLPRQVVDFFARHEPRDCAEDRQIRLWPIVHILEENRDMVPGLHIAPLGYIVFATTIYGDTYCFDLNKIDEQGEPPIVLISHEVVDEETTGEDVARLAKAVAKNLGQFLERFARGELDKTCIY
jgi:hypothetical protein